jgi:hypothetical protein
MKWVAGALAALFFGLCSVAVRAEMPVFGSTEAERLAAAMKSVRWTGPMLASNAETLPQGHFYTEPYFYDVIVGGDHHPGSSGFYQYGLLNSLTVGVQPSFATDTNRLGRGMTIGDFKLLSQLRLTHFTPEHPIPTIAIVLNEVLPTGKDDRLAAKEEGHGSGSFATEVGINVQHYFLLKNGRLLRARFNLLKSFPHGAHVSDRSVYGTALGFSGHAKPGSKTTLIGAVEYSVTREWVLALDVIHESAARTRLEGRYPTGPLVTQTFPSSRATGFAPAVEYNWSDRAGILLGVWVTPKGHNTRSSVTPAIAIQRFW